MRILSLIGLLSLSSLCYAQQIATPNFVPTWQPKFNLYQTDTITNIKLHCNPRNMKHLKLDTRVQLLEVILRTQLIMI